MLYSFYKYRIMYKTMPEHTTRCMSHYFTEITNNNDNKSLPVLMQNISTLGACLWIGYANSLNIMFTNNILIN